MNLMLHNFKVAFSNMVVWSKEFHFHAIQLRFSRKYWRRKLFWHTIKWLKKLTSPLLLQVFLQSPAQLISPPLKGVVIASRRSWAVVVQGPITELKQIARIEFFAKTLSRINVPVIVSCYETDLTQPLKESANCNLHFITSEYREIENNFQGQILTTYRGIYQAQLLNASHVLKVRSDQFIDLEITIPLISSFLDLFPRTSGSGERLVFASMNSWFCRPLGLSDMLVAGDYKSMAKYWEWNQETRNLTGNKVPLLHTGNSAWLSNRSLFCETFLFSNFLTKEGFCFSDNPTADYSRALKDYTIVVDSNVISHSWDKRDPTVVGNVTSKFASGLPSYRSKEISFVDWYKVSQLDYVLDLEGLTLEL